MGNENKKNNGLIISNLELGEFVICFEKKWRS
ncbi:MAG: hypothetical protein ACJAYJ_005046 [Saprospiraceae bacterium]|jgi:hypothetical protein